ncbi:TrkH family potassium uptake protein [Endozoicomonas euniceicola]|uniref:Trk system potassium uptake protein n=1 Tax=Endozoicomonas euniceicola TaxID=1234143 RepID=A0ABY6GUK7_9GAMM|nr:TrkH family potassium uptake protein [Endozoicomonas euniceicola]UYM16458.1 TrkH family potassium uptake protein [Endozoicomonas euniceicola]
MNIRPVLYVIGLFLTVQSLLMLVPALYDLLIHDPGKYAFLWSAAINLLTGLILCVCCRTKEFSLKARQIFLLTNLTWVTLSGFAALPFWIQLDISYTDAYFETMSAITTTGSTVLSGLDTMNKGILLWRSLLQWLGGIGFIVLAVAVLPFLKVGGMRLFQSESSDWSEKVMPRSGSIAKRIVCIYLGLTVCCAYLFFLGGMNGFEAINHAMTALSTGGFSTSDNSMGQFSNPFIHWTATIFMLLGGLPFVLFVKFLKGDHKALTKNTQVVTFVQFLLLTWAGLSIWLFMYSSYSFWESLTLVAFNTTSVVTTTGYALTDYTLWGGFAATAFFFLTFVGGCSGSTAGGVKIFRFEIGAKLLMIQLKQLAHPRACFVQSYNGQQISSDILRSLIAFSFFFGLLVSLLTLLLSLLGLDLTTSISGAATAVANVGPGLGDIIGPAGNFASLPDSAKWLLSLGMLMGRLEVITVLVLFTPQFWKG